ncbi:hypothetical protein C6P46_003467, partial [Rhodotorula mucilaginosa]
MAFSPTPVPRLPLVASRFLVFANCFVVVVVPGGQNVFLFDGIKKDVNDKEFYYEEFCYK